jgi:hypothetical protein
VSDKTPNQPLDPELQKRDQLIEDQTRRISELEREVGALKKIIDAWKRGHRVRVGGKLAQKKKPPVKKAAARARGRKPGHPGVSRPAPSQIDDHQACHPPPLCPFCGGDVAPLDKTPGTQLVEELVPATVKVIAYHRHYGQCTLCQKEVIAPPQWLRRQSQIGNSGTGQGD